jgi:ankyrin repeat protein
MDNNNTPDSTGENQYFPRRITNENNDEIMFIETFFDEGKLGVTLRRRADDGIVFVFEVLADSQAVNIDVLPGDELWAVDSSDIGGTPLDQEAWQGLINYIKTSPRPIRLVWKRTMKQHRPLPVPPASASSDSPSSQKVNPPQQHRMSVTPQTPVEQEQHSPEYVELKKVLVRLVSKDKESGGGGVLGGLVGVGAGNTGSLKKSSADPMSLLKEGRRLIKVGDVMVETKSNSIWTKQQNNKRRLILLNDLLLITIPQAGNVYSLESIIDLQVCKIKSLGYVFSLHANNVPSPELANNMAADASSSASQDGASTGDSNAGDTSFELLWPGGDIQLFAESHFAKDNWVNCIYLTICDCLKDGTNHLGWRHQYLIGTMHSAVLSRNEERVKDLIALCNAGRLDFKAIESYDEEGYTPLHYACMLRLQGIIKLLHEATADVTAADSHGLTPLHWSAMQLDDYSLSLLCSHVFDLDVTDHKNRTPLVIACIEGRDFSGVSDSMALKKCLEIMISHKPNCHWIDNENRSLLHYLAASLQYEPMEVLLENGCPDINLPDNKVGMTPLHYAMTASPIKCVIGEGMKIMNADSFSSSSSSSSSSKVLMEDNRPEPIQLASGVDTIRCLLQHGAKPNVKDSLGRTVLQFALMPEIEVLWDKEELEAVIALFLSFGYRCDDSLMTVVKSKYPDLNINALSDKWNSLQPIDCKKLDIK